MSRRPEERPDVRYSRQLACRWLGAKGPAGAIASLQAMVALKLPAGAPEAASPYLTKLDLWTGRLQRIDVVESCRNVDCPCCKRRDCEFLHPHD